jgi:ubiquitin-protein ligase E3 A
MNKLHQPQKKILLSWLKELEPEYFLKLVIMFKNVVQDYLLIYPEPENFVLGAIKALSVLSHANESNTFSIIPIEEFYARKLYAKLNFKDEFRKWKQTWEKQTFAKFAIFNYPFLFDPISKTRIMHIDAMVKMAKEYEETCVSKAFVMQAKRLFDSPEAMDDMEKELKSSTNPFFVLEIRRQHLVVDAMAQV